MTALLCETAFAKLNLALHVRAREADGYHRLETIFAFCEDGDFLTAEVADDLSLDVVGPFAAGLAGEDNLVLRAARALQARTGVRHGARLTLDKRLPVASGIGGGSADAAAALRLLVRLWGLDVAPALLHDIACGLGADVAACIDSRSVRGEGRGDVLRPVDGAALSGRPVLLVNPGVAVPTGPVFAGWDGIDRGPLPPGALIGRNDLEAPARRLAPAIGAVLAALGGAERCGMSGSGATCFGLYADAAERGRAAARTATAEPGWWLLETRLR
jgi:4-diphosphocytidyl-2-C-methyl-D-erythritol kinase